VDVALMRPAIVVGALLSSLTGCADDRGDATHDALDDESITVGSFDFPESVMLAELYSQALEGAGMPVVRAFGLGPREFVGPALSAGLIEFVPEYAGTAVAYFGAGELSPSADAAVTHRALDRAVEGTGIAVLEAAPAQNRNAFVVTTETARRYGLATLSDLESTASELVLGGPPECETRPLCQIGLRDRYGLNFAGFVALDAGGPVTHQALGNGDVDVALLFQTDPRLPDYVELVDDRLLQPAENITPLVHADVVERWGTGLVELIDSVSRKLDSDALRQLNTADAAAPGTDDVAAIAAEWLHAEGLA
jgi:osmoprotectant transport system substrate-binding protein